MAVYKIVTKLNEKDGDDYRTCTVTRLVRAKTREKAIAHVVADTMTVEVAKPDDLVTLGGTGIKLEDLPT